MQNADMKHKFIYLFFTFAFLFSGCDKIDLGKPFDCQIGTTYSVTHDLSFTIDRINDSRCPENVICVWAGEVHLFINITYANSNIDTVLYQDPQQKYPYRFGDYKFSVLDVQPITAGDSESKDIKIKMIITRD